MPWEGVGKTGGKTGAKQHVETESGAAEYRGLQSHSTGSTGLTVERVEPGEQTGAVRESAVAKAAVVLLPPGRVPGEDNCQRSKLHRGLRAAPADPLSAALP